MTKTIFPFFQTVLKRLLAVPFFLAIAGCGLAPGLGNSQSSTGPNLAETGKVYALIDEGLGAGDLRKSGQALGYDANPTINLPALGLVMVPFDLPETVSGKQAIDALENAVPQSTVGVNHAYQLQAVSTSNTRKTFANTLIGWPAGGCLARQSIGLIDGGVNLAALPQTDAKVMQKSFAATSTLGQRHGTETASVLTDPSRLSGARVFSANVVSQDANGQAQASATNIVEALNWLAANNVGVANISLAGPFNKLLALGVDAASQRGLTIVAAAGNDWRVAPVQYPAALPSVVAVTAIDARQRVYATAVRGDHVDFAAPGVDIFVGSSEGGRYVTGTSMAAPFVSALLASYGRADLAQIRAESLDLGRSGKDDIFGHGLIQARDVCGR